ncbi:MAG: hypothetical protein FWF43_06865 [Propionibacteriaceae bacterium]|nr:hypothetical protein [Propionibacteriaceae bacterium]
MSLTQNSSSPAGGFLKGIFSFFLAVGIVSFVYVFWTAVGWKQPPDPDSYSPTSPSYVAYQHAMDLYSVATSVFYVVMATVLMAVSLWVLRRWTVIPDGMLLAGLGLLVWSGIAAWDATLPYLRLAVIGVALAICLVAGYVRFIKGSRTTAVPSGVQASNSFGGGYAHEQRIAALEKKLSDLGAVLASPAPAGAPETQNLWDTVRITPRADWKPPTTDPREHEPRPPRQV